MPRLASLLVVVACAACAGKDPSKGTCLGSFAPGDLVITEVMANPAGSDSGKEWFEIYNHGHVAVDLTGLTLVASKNDGTGAQTHTMTTVMLDPGAYLALGGVAPDLKPGFIGYGYGSSLTMRNDSGLVALRCGDTIVDQVTYATTVEGQSWELNEAVPDALGNDDPTAWCAASAPLYDGTDAGTPGMANQACGTTGVPGMCNDGGTLRPVVKPTPGDLVITEVMADPKAVSDTAGEWFEVLALADVDLNGVGIGAPGATPKALVTSTDCVKATSGSYLVLANNGDMATNGGLPRVDVVYPSAFTLTNSGGTFALSIDGTLLDAATYGTTTSGTALQLDPTMLDPGKNDVATAFCAATMTYGAGDKGTPGAVNTACGTVVTPDMCNDGGTMRALVKPVPGDLVITEVMADPAAVADASGEWFEVLATADVDLNGVGIGAPGATPKAVVISADCVTATSGSYLVFANNGDMMTNGGLPRVDVVYASAFALANAGGTFALSIDGTLLDAATYAAATSGTSWSLDPTKLDTTSNDSAGNFCLATATYGAGDKGTPGAANTSCGTVVPPDTCLDGNVMRAVVKPKAGDLVITEVMADPKAVTDATGEWFEVLAKADVDLNGVGIGAPGATPKAVVTSPACIRATSGHYVVFANNSNMMTNGGLPVGVVAYDPAFTLTNAGSTFALSIDGTLLDAATYAAATSGVSWSLDPTKLDTASNDVAGNFCLATMTFGAGDKGSPGQANPPCM